MSKRKVLIVGGGGREHALAWKIAQSPHLDTLYIAPGNAGTAALGTNVAIPADAIASLLDFVAENNIDLTVIGPEVPLALGLVDALAAVGRRAFGPSAVAARIESSKAFAKDFMRQHNIPTAEYATFTQYDAASRYLDNIQGPVVVKADGLAAGKGVILCDTVAEARDATRRMMQDEAFGRAGSHVVIEERMTGAEVSLLAFTDGKMVVPMPAARDHKQVYDGNRGPNTGGMGAYAPPSDVSPELAAEIVQRVVQPAVDGLAAAGTPFVGVLYAGVMLTPNGLRTLEYNCRFGDPETQVLLPLLETDLLDVMTACVDGTLDQLEVRWRDGACATVVLASPGYPDAYPRGMAISGVDDVRDSVVFHAGTAIKEGQLVTNGGRVLAVSAVGDDLDAAIATAYADVQRITFPGAHFRTDIGKPNATN